MIKKETLERFGLKLQITNTNNKWFDKLTTLSQVEGQITTRGASACVARDQNSKSDELVKSPKTVMPDLIPVEVGIFDRHP